MNRIWQFIVSLFGILTLGFLYQKNKRDEAESSLANEKFGRTDDKVVYEIESAKRQNEELKERLKRQEETKTVVPDLTPDEAVKYWSKK